MKNKDTGEFELVVGNGQLVSGFFIVIVLFALGVAMGYIVGQNSEKSAKAQQADAAPCVATDARPQPSQPTSQPPAQTSTPPADTAAQTTPEEPPKPTTKPAREPETAAAATPPPPKTEPKPEPKAAATTSDAPSGFFWQVTAKANLESARATLRILQERGFAAYLVPGPNNLTKVLVGPYTDTPSKAKAKTDLEAMGFKGPFPVTRE